MSNEGQVENTLYYRKQSSSKLFGVYKKQHIKQYRATEIQTYGPICQQFPLWSQTQPLPPNVPGWYGGYSSKQV